MDPQLSHLVTNIGEFIEYWGFKAIHGKVWAIVFLAKTAPNQSTIIETLEISKASASLTLKDLIEFGLIFEAEKNSPDGTRRYLPNLDLISCIHSTLKNRELKMLERVKTAQKELASNLKKPSTDFVDLKRVNSLGKMIGQAELTLHSFLAFAQINAKPWMKTFNLSESQDIN